MNASRREIAAVVLVLALSLFLRLADLDALVVSDEMRWMCRSLGFQDAVLRGDWRNAFRVGHPGVVTTWLGTLSIPRRDGLVRSGALATCQITDDAKRLNEAGETSKEVSKQLREVGELLFVGRIGIAVFTWVSVVAIFLLIRLLWGPEIGVTGLILVGLSPFYLAHSRFLHVDAVLASLMTVSVLGLLAAARQGTKGRLAFLTLSGAAGGLAAVQKSPAMFLAPFTALVLAIDMARRGVNRERVLQVVRDLALWGATAGLIYIAVWPAMWVAPIETLQRVLGKAVDYAEEGHTLGNYFMGRPVLDPGWSFYPIAILFRLGPLTVVGILACVGWWARGKRQRHERFGIAVLVLYTVLFGAFMSLGAKKFDRYALPVFPALEISAAFGLVWLHDVAREHTNEGRKSWIALIGVVGAVASSLLLTLPHRPHYLTAYNPLLGGVRRAKDVLLLGWGEGYEEVVPYLNAKPGAEELQVAVSRFSGFAPAFKGEPRSMRTYSAWETDYVVIYVGQVQRRRYESLLEDYFYNPKAKAEHVVTLHGVDYAWIYRNEHYVAPVAYLERAAEPDARDCLLVNGNSLFAEHYQGGLPIFAFEGRWNPAEETHFYWDTQEVAGLLDEASRSCLEIWYARYPEYESEGYVHLLESRGLLVSRVSFPHMELLHYRLAEPRMEEMLDLPFEGLRLVGWGTSDPAPAWGRDGGLFMAWEATDPLAEDYSVFLHLFDAYGRRIAQGDSLLVDRDLQPTSQWDAGRRKAALYHLPIPAGTPPGRYELVVGVYDLETRRRLPLVTEEGDSTETSARLDVEIGTPDRPVPLELLDISHPVEQNLAGGLKLAGYYLEDEAVLVGDALGVRLTWQVVGAPEADYQLTLGLRDEAGELHASSKTDLVGTDYPTSEWQPGEVLQAWYYLPVTDTLATGDAMVSLSLVTRDEKQVLASWTPLEEVWVQSMMPRFELPEGVDDSSASVLGEKVRFLAFEAAPSVRAGARLPVTVYWQAEQSMDVSYKVFVHVYDEKGEIVAQLDRVPGLGARPTTAWQAGEILGDRLLVPVDSGAPVGEYQLAVGLYDEATGDRLTARGPTGARWKNDRVVLGDVEIDP